MSIIKSKSTNKIIQIQSTNKIIQILMNRDHMSEQEATDYYNSVKPEINDAIASGNVDLVEDLMAEEFGLEPDYIEYLL